MAIKHIVIAYDDAQLSAEGEFFDLYDYLINEFENKEIITTMLESSHGLSHACDDFRECYNDHS